MSGVEALEEWARNAGTDWVPTDDHHRLVVIALHYGEHTSDCHKFGTNGSIENDCSCGWGSISYYLRQTRRRTEV